MSLVKTNIKDILLRLPKRNYRKSEIDLDSTEEEWFLSQSLHPHRKINKKLISYKKT